MLFRALLICTLLFAPTVGAQVPEAISFYFHLHQATGHLELSLIQKDQKRRTRDQNYARGHLSDMEGLLEKHNNPVIPPVWLNFLGEFKTLLAKKKVAVTDVENFRFRIHQQGEKDKLRHSPSWHHIIRCESEGRTKDCPKKNFY